MTGKHLGSCHGEDIIEKHHGERRHGRNSGMGRVSRDGKRIWEEDGEYKLLISDSVLYARLGSLIVPEWFREEELTRERSHTNAWWSSPPLTRTCLDEGAH